MKNSFSKDFILLVIGQIVSLFGNQILRYALPLYLLNETGSSVLFGTILAVSFVPMLVVFPIGGILADRVNKRNILVWLDFCTSAWILLFCLLDGIVDIVPLMALTMMVLCGIQGAYQPAVNASIPALVRPDQMMQGNSIINMINSTASMAGPVIGGILFASVGLIPILYVSTGCFLGSAVMEIFIRIPYEKRSSEGRVFATGMKDLKESIWFMFRKQPVLWKVALIYSSMGFLLTALILIALPVLITQHLGFVVDTANRLYGYAQGALGAGAVLGGLGAVAFSERLTSRIAPVILVTCALSVGVGGMALQWVNDRVGIYLILLVVGSLLTTLSTLLQIQVMTFLQFLTPQILIGKVVSCFICICMCAIPLGQFLYGVVFDRIVSRMYLPFYVAAVCMIGITMVTLPVFREIGRLVKVKDTQ